MDFLLLAQAHPPNTGLIEKLARTPLHQIVWFAALCTALRIVAVSLMPRVSESNTAGRVSLRILHDASDALIYAAVVVFLLLRPYVLQTFQIPSESMVPTLKVNDWLIVNKFAYRIGDPKFGDIVVFKPPKRALAPWQPPDQDFVKRLIGEPGDLIEIRDSVLYRNGQEVPQPYLNEKAIGDFKLVKYNGELIPLVRFGTGGPPPPGQPLQRQGAGTGDGRRVGPSCGAGPRGALLDDGRQPELVRRQQGLGPRASQANRRPGVVHPVPAVPNGHPRLTLRRGAPEQPER